MCQLISLKIKPHQQKQWRKNLLYIHWECQTIYSTLYLKFCNPQLKLFKKRHDFARLIFAFKKFQEMGTESIAFQLVILQYLKKHLTKIVHWLHYGIIIVKVSLLLIWLIGALFPCKFSKWNTFFLIVIHSMHDWTATARHGVKRKRSTKWLKHTENLFRKYLQLIGACLF